MPVGKKNPRSIERHFGHAPTHWSEEMNHMLAAAALVAASAGVAQAGVTDTYFAELINVNPATALDGPGNPVVAARNAFLSNFDTIFEEDFEDRPIGAPAGGDLELNFGPISATLSGPGEVREFPPGLQNRFNTTVGGSRYFDTQVDPGDNDNNTSPPFTITFSQAINAFGFYATDIGDFGGQIVLTLNDDVVSEFIVPNTIGSNGSTDPSVLFFGFITDTAFDTIVFSSTASDTDGFGFDDMLFGTSRIIPLPGAAGMAMVGVAGLAIRRRR